MRRIELDKHDSAIIIKADNKLKLIIPSDTDDCASGTSYVAAVIVFMLQNDFLFKKVNKIFQKKIEKKGNIPIQVDSRIVYRDDNINS